MQSQGMRAMRNGLKKDGLKKGCEAIAQTSEQASGARLRSGVSALCLPRELIDLAGLPPAYVSNLQPPDQILNHRSRIAYLLNLLI